MSSRDDDLSMSWLNPDEQSCGCSLFYTCDAHREAEIRAADERRRKESEYKRSLYGDRDYTLYNDVGDLDDGLYDDEDPY